MRFRWAAFGVAAVAGASLGSPVAAAAATLTVNTTKDELAPGRGKCSLREAIQAVDVPSRRTTCGVVGRRSNLIVLGRGRYTLSIRPVGPDDNTSGDLNVTTTTPLTLTSADSRGAEIDGHSLGDRVLSVASGASVSLAGLTITGGHAPAAANGMNGAAGAGCSAGAAGGNGLGGGGGGGIYNSGRLALEMVTVTGNAAGAGGAGGSAGAGGCGGGSGGAGGNGGGIYSQGTLSVTAATISENRAGAGGAGGQGASGVILPGTDGTGGQGGLGGGIYSTSGRLTVTNSTLVGNFAGAGGAGGGMTGAGGGGGSGGALAVVAGPSQVRNATVAGNGVGVVGAHGGSAVGGSGGGVFVQSRTAGDVMRLQNTIAASNLGSNCAGSPISDAGHDLSYGDGTCPGGRGTPRLGPLKDNGGPTLTMALGHGSAALDRVPLRTGGCPPTDQRGVRRPQGKGCDIGAYEFATPSISIVTPAAKGSYEFRSRIPARFRCDEGGVVSAISTCKGTVAPGRPIGTARTGVAAFVVTAVDKSGNRAARTTHYDVWQYVNPVARVSALMPRRIDLGVDYGGFGPLLAIGRGRVTFASNTDSGPPSCWAISCWPGGGIVVYRLLDGPYAGKYVYVAEHITVSVRAGETISPGQQIATLYLGYPWSEWGWAAGPGPEAMAMADGHKCSPCSDPGNWSTIEGRNMNHLLVGLGAPSGLFQGTPSQSMPAGWPTWP